MVADFLFVFGEYVECVLNWNWRVFKVVMDVHVHFVVVKVLHISLELNDIVCSVPHVAHALHMYRNLLMWGKGVYYNAAYCTIKWNRLLLNCKRKLARILHYCRGGIFGLYRKSWYDTWCKVTSPDCPVNAVRFNDITFIL